MKEKKKEKLRDAGVSDKKIRQVEYICEKCDIKFKGKTKKDVKEFIAEWEPRAEKIAAMESNMGPISIPVYSAHKTYNGNDVHGEWEETLNLRNTIAHEKLKEDILRGRNAMDALLDFQRNAKWETLLGNDDEYDIDDDYDDYDY